MRVVSGVVARGVVVGGAWQLERRRLQWPVPCRHTYRACGTALILQTRRLRIFRMMVCGLLGAWTRVSDH